MKKFSEVGIAKDIDKWMALQRPLHEVISMIVTNFEYNFVII